MKHLILLFLAVTLYGQPIKVKIRAENKADLKYDSLNNFLRPNLIRAYIGQSLLPKPKNQKKYGYRDFFESPDTEGKKFMSNSNGVIDFTPYEIMEGKTFKVVDVVNEKFLKLEYLPNKYFYYKYTINESAFPFLVEGYLNKLKKDYLNQDLYFTHALDDYWTDFKTGEKINLLSGSLWTISEIILNNSYFLEFLINNRKGQTLSIPVESYTSNFILKSTGDQYKRLYGKFYESALRGILEIGMPTVLVKLAWGEPTDINKNMAGEHWYYSYKKKILFFKSGKLIEY